MLTRVAACVALVTGSLGLSLLGQTSLSTGTIAAKPWTSQILTINDAVLYDVSCPTATTCVAVGYEGDRPSDESPIVATEGPRGWTTEAVSAPVGTTLASVSCPAVGSCISVGATGNGATSSPYALVLNRGKWHEAPVPSPTKGGGSAGLGAVSCQSAHSCIAVGQWYDDSLRANVGKDIHAIVYSFDGAQWAILKLPARLDFTLLSGVSCEGKAALDCTAVGVAYTGLVPVDAPTVPTALRYMNGSWLSVAVPGGDDNDALYDVWCGRDSCIGVGEDLTDKGRPFVVNGTGNRWAKGSIPAASEATDLEAVSCVESTSACAAVGQGPPGGVGYVFDWAGRWRAQAASFPASTGHIGGLSCVGQDSGAECTLVGSEGGVHGLDHPFVMRGLFAEDR